MKMDANILVKVSLTLSILMMAIPSYAEMTLEQQVKHLQQQVQEL